MNKVLIMAALVRIPELTYTPSGLAIFSATVAGEQAVIDQHGETRNIPFYAPVQVMGKYAENLAERSLQAGDVLVIDGQIDYSQWERDGVKASAIRTKITGGVRQAGGDFELVTDAAGGVRLKGGFSRVSVIGNLAADAELRYTPGGDAVAELRLAVNEKWKDRNGQPQEKVHWIKTVLWRDLAVQYGTLKKGDSVLVEGHYSDSAWTDKEGNKRKETRLEAEMVVALKRSAVTGAAPTASAKPRELVAAGSRGQAAPGGLDIDQGLSDFPSEEDLPF